LGALGEFTFSTIHTDGTAYDVTVVTAPAGQNCQVTGGSGSIAGADVSNIVVNCLTIPTYSVGGTVSGLTDGTVVLQVNGAGDVSRGANGVFTFPSVFLNLAGYNVSVKTHPTGQTCTVVNGNGIIGSNDITNVVVSCANIVGPTYSIGGTLSGLNGTVVLQNNGGDDLSLSSNDVFTFATELANRASFHVTVKTQPTGQVCNEANATGTVVGADVTAVSVVCVDIGEPRYFISVTASGLTGTAVLQNNGGDNLNVTANGSFTFNTQLTVGSAYDVTVLTQPAGQTCSVGNGSGIMTAAPVFDVTLTCEASGGTYTIGGFVTGLTGGTVVLQNNGGDDESVSADAPFVFATGLASGATYNVTVKTHPEGQTCTVANGSGSVATLPVTDVMVTCAEGGVTYYIGGLVTYTPDSPIVVQNNGGDDLTVSSAGGFMLPTELPAGASYNVTVLTQPVGQTCTVINGTGTVVDAPVANVYVVCPPPNYYYIGGNVTGATGMVRLRLNSAYLESITTNRPFTFRVAVEDGGYYNVDATVRPAGQNCLIENGTGTVAGADVTDVTVTCGSDLTPPEKPVVSVDRYDTNDPQPTWSWVSGGGDGAGVYRYLLDSSGAAFSGTETTATSYTPDSPLPDGRHNLFVVERDAFGNWSAEAIRAVGIDTVAPIVEAAFPAMGSTHAGLTTTVEVTYDDLEVDWDSFRDNVVLLDPSGASVPGTTSPYYAESIFTPDAPLLTDTTYTVDISGTADPAGNLVTPTSWQFTTRKGVAFYPAAPNWNDYVKNDGPSVFESSGTACDGSETGGYQSCIHGGEMRVFDLPGYTSCAGLSAADALGALEWICRDVGGEVKFVSVGLRDDVVLHDLLKFQVPRGFLANALIVWDGSTEVFTTGPDPWWNNWVIFGKPASVDMYMDQPGVVYAFNSHLGNNDLFVTADRIAIAIARWASFTSRGNNGGSFYAANRKFLWIEGDFDARGDIDGWQFTNLSHSVLRQFYVSGAELGSSTLGKGGIYMTGSNNNRIEDVAVAFNGTGLNMVSSDDNTISYLQAMGNLREVVKITSSSGNMILNLNSNNNGTGVWLGAGANHNLLGQATITGNAGHGLRVNGSGNRIGLVTSLSNGLDGVHMETGDYNLLFNIAAGNNAQHGIALVGTSSTTVLNLASAHNGPAEAGIIGLPTSSYGVVVDNADVYFTGQFKVGGNGSGTADDCVVGGTVTGLNTDCTPANDSDHTLTTAVDATGSFVADTGEDDTVNFSDAFGWAAYPTLNVLGFDWWDFENPLRNWVADGYGILPGGATVLLNRGRFGCNAPQIIAVDQISCNDWGDAWHGDGVIFDSSLRASDTVLRDVAPIHLTGDAADTITHTWLGVGSDTFLRNAVEAVEAHPFALPAGDGDGLCESGERCLYTPNLGSYTGNGEPVPAGTFSDGDTLSGVILLEFPTNGE